MAENFFPILCLILSIHTQQKQRKKKLRVSQGVIGNNTNYSIAHCVKHLAAYFLANYHNIKRYINCTTYRANTLFYIHKYLSYVIYKAYVLSSSEYFQETNVTSFFHLYKFQSFQIFARKIFTLDINNYIRRNSNSTITALSCFRITILCVKKCIRE